MTKKHDVIKKHKDKFDGMFLVDRTVEPSHGNIKYLRRTKYLTIVFGQSNNLM